MKNGIPLINTNDSALVARGYNLGLKLVPNLLQVMTEDQLVFFENNLPTLQDAAKRAVTLTEPSATTTQVFTKPPRLRIEILSETPKPCAKRTVDEQVAEWVSMYRQLGSDFSEAGLMIPPRQEGFDRLLVPAKGLTNNRAYDWCDASFPCWRRANDLDVAVPTNDRDPRNGYYAVWVRDRVEADEELNNLSADMLAEKKIKSITLLERVLYEAKYYRETGQHLDILNWTLCAGSRYLGGDVPRACWSDDGFKVDWDSRDTRSPYLRSREAVSL